MDATTTGHAVEHQDYAKGFDTGVGFMSAALRGRISRRREAARTDEERNAYDEALRIVNATRAELLETQHNGN